MLLSDHLGRGMKLPSPTVVAQPLPEFKHFGFVGCSQFFDRRKSLHEPFVVADHRGNLGLLQHDFADPNSIRRFVFTPWQVTLVLVEPF